MESRKLDMRLIVVTCIEYHHSVIQSHHVLTDHCPLISAFQSTRASSINYNPTTNLESVASHIADAGGRSQQLTNAWNR